jgi:hypothetical protein
MTNLFILLQDKYLFYILEGSILIILIVAILIDIINKSNRRRVKRGRKSLSKIKDFFFLITTWGVIELTINTAGPFKIFFCIFNMSIFIYLIFFNSWFRNLIITVTSRFENKLENH